MKNLVTVYCQTTGESQEIVICSSCLTKEGFGEDHNVDTADDELPCEFCGK